MVNCLKISTACSRVTRPTPDRRRRLEWHDVTVTQWSQEYHSQHPDMPEPLLALIAEPEELERNLEQESILSVDLCKQEVYAQSHIPGAVRLDYAQIVAADKPVMGLLPSESQLNEVFSSIGLIPEHHVVAYDDEGGGRASRLLWTLEAMGHARYSLLNGGLHAWTLERRPLKSGRTSAQPVPGTAKRRRGCRQDLHSETPGDRRWCCRCAPVDEYPATNARRVWRAYTGRRQSRLDAGHGSRPWLALKRRRRCARCSLRWA